MEEDELAPVLSLEELPPGMKRRLLASLLTLVMMLNLLPTVAWARNDEGIDADSVEMYM